MKVLKSIRFDSDSLESIERLASARQMTLANVIRNAVDLYLQKEALDGELKSMEERLAASLLRGHKETVKVSEDVQLLIAIIDQLTQFIMFSTPEVIDREAAAAVGNRRHTLFIADLHKAFSTRRRKATVTETLEGMEGENA